MAPKIGMCILLILIFFKIPRLRAELVVYKDADQQYCSFFNNRAPKAQPGLKNCTWFKGNSCCQQQEIAETFNRMKPLKGASLECQKYINYLMCYICAPNQNIFYRKERLTVCLEFCDKLYEVCRTAILKGSIIENLYNNGSEFCGSRRFEIEVGTTRCFSFDEKLDTSGSTAVNASRSLVVLLSMITLCISLHLSQEDTYTLCFSSKKARKRCIKRDKDKVKSDHVSNLSLSNVDNCTPGRKNNHQCQVRETNKQCKGLTNINITCPGVGQSYLNLPMVIMSKNMSIHRCCLEKLLLTILVFIMHIKCGYSAELTQDDIKMWAELISGDLTDVAQKGLRYEEIQRLYDKAQYATEYINGTSKVLEVRDKLGMCIQ